MESTDKYCVLVFYTPLAYSVPVIFVETPTFTKRVLSLLDDESYGALQTHLAKHPGDGAIIRGGGGLRKIRWAAKGIGKRGGVRVIYYWWTGKDRISMLLKLLRQALDLEL